MRPTKSRSRSKNRNNRPSGTNIINRVFDSSGPDGKVRGTPQQIIDKYNQLHRDSQLSGDRVAAENFAQHAEHYLRLLAEAQREAEKARLDQEEANRRRQADRDRDRAARQKEVYSPDSNSADSLSAVSDEQPVYNSLPVEQPVVEHTPVASNDAEPVVSSEEQATPKKATRGRRPRIYKDKTTAEGLQAIPDDGGSDLVETQENTAAPVSRKPRKPRTPRQGSTRTAKAASQDEQTAVDPAAE